MVYNTIKAIENIANEINDETIFYGWEHLGEGVTPISWTLYQRHKIAKLVLTLTVKDIAASTPIMKLNLTLPPNTSEQYVIMRSLQSSVCHLIIVNQDGTMICGDDISEGVYFIDSILIVE